jgi:hypothetical protein
MFAGLIAEFADIDLQNVNVCGAQFESVPRQFFVKIDCGARRRFSFDYRKTFYHYIAFAQKLEKRCFEFQL